MEKTKTSDEKKYPAVHIAYDIAVKSYDWALHRSDAIDNGIDKFLVWISSINIGVVAIASTKFTDISFHSCWAIFAIMMLGGGIFLGIWAKVKGSLILPSPKKIYDKYLHYTQWEFKKNWIYFSGEHFEANRQLINQKGRLMMAMAVLFLLNLVTLVGWITSLD